MNSRESSRLKQFRQLKKEIRGSKDHLIVGIDVAKDTHKAFFGTATGKTLLKRLVFENTREGFERLLIHQEALSSTMAFPIPYSALSPPPPTISPWGSF